MTKKELKVIRSCISAAQDAIEHLATENYPYTDFCDEDLSDIFYQLNSMCILLTDKMEELT